MNFCLRNVEVKLFTLNVFKLILIKYTIFTYFVFWIFDVIINILIVKFYYWTHSLRELRVFKV